MQFNWANGLLKVFQSEYIVPGFAESKIIGAEKSLSSNEEISTSKQANLDVK
jgi:hypothetical protein